MLVPEFEKVVRKLEQQVTLRGQSKSTLQNDIRRIALFVVHIHTVKRNLNVQFAPEEKPDIDTIIRQQKPPESNMERLERLTGVNPCLCPVCKKGRMIAIRELPRIRSPAWDSFGKPLAP